MARRFAGVGRGGAAERDRKMPRGVAGRRDWANAAGCWLRRAGQPERGREIGLRSHDRRRRHAAVSRDARSDKQDGSRSLRGQTTWFWLRAFLLGAVRPGALPGDACAPMGCPTGCLSRHNVTGHPDCLADGDARLRVCPAVPFVALQTGQCTGQVLKCYVVGTTAMQLERLGAACGSIPMGFLAGKGTGSDLAQRSSVDRSRVGIAAEVHCGDGGGGFGSLRRSVDC